MDRPNAWNSYNKTDLKKLEDTAKEYRAFLDAGKTERECAAQAIAALEDRINAIHRHSLDGSTALQCFPQESA